MGNETIIIQKPEEQSSEQQLQETQLNQAMTFGQMTEAFRQTQTEVAQTRSEFQNYQSQQQAIQARLEAIATQNSQLLQAIAENEEEDREEVKTEPEIITPPAPELPKESEILPKKKQSKMNLFLFGKDDDE